MQRQGQVTETKKHVAEFSKRLLAWYAWTSFYRWVIATGVALLVAFAGFSGTILLLDQNERLSEQNEIEALDITSKLRQELRIFSSKVITTLDKKSIQQSWQFGLCSISRKDIPVRYEANASVITSIAALAKNDALRKRIREALLSLLDDDDATVALGALVTLERLNINPGNVHLELNGIFVLGLDINTDVVLDFKNSIFQKFSCKNCIVYSSNSVMAGLSAASLSMDSSVYFGNLSHIGTARNSILIPHSFASNEVTEFTSSIKLINDMRKLRARETIILKNYLGSPGTAVTKISRTEENSTTSDKRPVTAIVANEEGNISEHTEVSCVQFGGFCDHSSSFQCEARTKPPM